MVRNLPTDLPTALVATCVCLLVASGCNRNMSDDRPTGAAVIEAMADDSNPSTPNPSVQIPLENLLPSIAIEPTDNPREWSLETFQDAAHAQLKALQQLVLKSGNVAELRTIALDEAWSGRLSSRDDNVTFRNESLVVRQRLNNDTEKRSPLESELAALATVFAQTSDNYGKLKISGVREDTDSVETTVEVQFIGKAASKVTEYDARWKCEWTKSPQSQPKLKHIQPQKQTLVSRDRVVGFRDQTHCVIGNTASFRDQLAHGVDHWMERIEQRYGINSSGWQGIAIGDANGDGLDDIYVLQPGGLPNRLYLQQHDGTVEDRSVQAGVDWWDHSHAALFLDLDNDADQDLVIGTALGLIFMSNDGTGRFEVAATKLCPGAIPFTLAAADFDQDGDLDVYACCYSPRGNAIGTQFLGRPVPYHDANNGGRNCLFRNDGNWNFKNATLEVGLDENNRRFSLAASWEDYDNDGDQDLYVANDYGRNNLYRNEDGRFKDVAAEAGVEDLSAGMSVAWGDYNQDGDADLYVSNMWSSAGNRITYQRQFQQASTTTTKKQFQRHARGNSLFLNLGDGTFADTTISSGVSLGRWAWGSQFVDLNNDSREDLVVANGFITQADESDL